MMPKGDYYIGDLCYVMDDVWDEVCSNLVEGENVLSDGRRYAFYHTMYGDGCYRSNIGTNHPVDAGLIGAIKLSDIGKIDLGLGACVSFNNDFHTESVDGTIIFGHVRINTSCINTSCDDDEEDDWWEDDDEEDDDD